MKVQILPTYCNWLLSENIKFDEISENDMGAGWSKYGAPDEREINTLKGKLNDWLVDSSMFF